MAYRHFVQIGRVACIAFGRDAGKLCAIVDVIDHNRALVEGPCTGVSRQPVQFKRLRLTRFRLKFPHGTSARVVRQAWEKEGITEKWAETSTAKKMAARNLRSTLTDFDRFKIYKAKQAMNREIRLKFLRLKGKARRNPVKSKIRRPKKKAQTKK